jgi:hypothetical protein
MGPSTTFTSWGSRQSTAIFNRPIALGPKDGSRFQRVIAAVSPENSYTVMPSPLLEMLGIEPEWTDVLKAPDGGQEEYSLAEVRVRIDDRERTTVCVFGKADGPPILGKYTLDGFGLAVDEANRRLVPARLFLD